MIDYGEWNTKMKTALTELRDKMLPLVNKLRPARDKLQAHNDRATILMEHELGSFERGEDTEYFKHLCKFASIVRKTVLGNCFYTTT
jgi:hypothetical protein